MQKRTPSNTYVETKIINNFDKMEQSVLDINAGKQLS
jgi:hypothetical protein